MPPLGPAEALLLIRPWRQHPFEYVSYTLAELLMLGVLQIEHRRVRSNPNDRAVNIQPIVQQGMNFQVFSPFPYQAGLLEYFYATDQISLIRLARLLKRDWDPPRRFSTELLKPRLVELGWLSAWQLPKGEGRDLSKMIKRENRLIARSLAGWIANKSDALRQKLAQYGPLLLMMPDVPFKALAAIPDSYTEITRLPSQPSLPRYYDWSMIPVIPSFTQLKYFDSWLGQFERAFASTYELSDRKDASGDFDLIDPDDVFGGYID